jgi:large subunit ribosomal protein L10
LNREQKAAVIDEVAVQITEAEAVYAVDYRGTSVPQAAQLRTQLRDADARFRVVKNTLTERAADQAGAAALKEYLAGPTALVFVRGDAAAAAKTLSDFRRTSGLLAFKGGWMGGDVLSAEQVDAIARLPSREVLYGRLVGMVASPLTGLASALGGLIGGLARQLQQIADQNLVGGAAAASANGDAAAAGDTVAAASAEGDTAAAGDGDALPAAETPPAGEPSGDDQDGDTDAGPATTTEEAGPHPDPTPETETETQED